MNKTVRDGADILDSVKKAEFEYCRDDLIYFASNYCFFEDRDSEELIVPFKPWQEQKEALLSVRDNRLNLFLKARQVGITWVALIYCAWAMIYNPGFSILAISKTRADANELVRRLGVIFDNMKALLSGGGISAEIQKESVSLSFGRVRSVFRSLPASPSAGRSLTANIILIDEWAFQEWAREIWTAAYPTVNRPSGGKVIGISTIKKGTLFEELWLTGEGWHKKFISVFADPRRDREWYERTKKDLGQRIREEYPRSADEALANVGGLFFHELDSSIHVCDPFAIPSSWRVYTAMDYGLDMLAHYRFAIDNENNVFVIDEIYESGLVVSEAAKRIKESDQRWGDRLFPRARLAPPDLFSREAGSGKSQVTGFLENGIVLTRSSNNRESGWLFVKELLRPYMDARGCITSKIKIFSTCTNLIRSMSSILVDPKNPCDCKREPHELTHSVDALRYFAIWWWQSSSEKSKKSVGFTRQDMMDDYERAGRDERRRLEKSWSAWQSKN